MAQLISTELAGRLYETLQTEKYATGKTHNFYHYPARFHPDVAKAVIEHLSAPDDYVLDPFMGGGTAIVEGLALGRRMVGTDINALARFVADVRTTPLSAHDTAELRCWALHCAEALPHEPTESLAADISVPNLPSAVQMFVAGGLRATQTHLSLPRQRAFARCALLRLGQWALDCRDFAAPRRKRLAEELPRLLEEMLAGMEEFVEACRASGVRRNKITARRRLLHRTAVGIDEDRDLQALEVKPKLVFTSPPYPAVHVLYHRWQYRGRRETSAPFWIAGVKDGHGGAFYTAGSRTPTGLRNYFATIKAAFRSVRGIIDSSAFVVQLVGFSDPVEQLPLYLHAMTEAGFAELPLDHPGGTRLRRRVANRKWYAKLQERDDAACEILLIHRPAPVEEPFRTVEETRKNPVGLVETGTPTAN